MANFFQQAKQYATQKKWQYFISWIEILGVICFVIGIIALLGYLFNQERLYTWGEATPGMALPSALVSTFGGLAIFLTGLTLQKHAHDI